MWRNRINFAGLKVFGLALVLTGLWSFSAMAQKTSRDNYTGNWDNNASWVDNSAPEYTDIGSTNEHFHIYGYITVGDPDPSTQDDMTFAVNKNDFSFNIYDTLVVFGNVSFGNDAMDLVLHPGSFFIVFGDMELKNKLNISATGNIIVTGDFDKVGAQGSFSGSGNVYAGGEFNLPNPGNNWVPPSNQKDMDDLENDYPDIWNFVNSGGTIPLPVQFLYFKGSASGLRVALDWATVREERFDYFDVERSNNGRDYQSIATVKGKGGEIVTQYQHIDYPEQAGRYYYRLKSVDIDRTFEYSKTIAVLAGDAEERIGIYPNPVVNRRFNVRGLHGPLHLTVFDQLGKVYAEKSLDNYDQEIQLHDNIPDGVYFVKISGSDVTERVKLVVTNRN